MGVRGPGGDHHRHLCGRYNGAKSGNDPVLNRIAWYIENSGYRTQPVGQKAPNPWGLYDMLGNVFEWVGDWNGAYPGGTVTDPTGLGAGSYRLNRGGGWFYRRRVLPVGETRRDHQRLVRRVPPAEDGVTLGSITL